jgi:predicted anti-sigma-YlaC factor YlaD
MNCTEKITMIHSYLDGELPKSEEPVLFTHLANCPHCRDEFKLLGTIQNEFLSAQEEFPPALENRIFSSIRAHRTSFFSTYVARGVPAYVFYLSTIVVVVTSFYLYGEVSDMKNNIAKKSEQIEFQQIQLNSLLESMPAAKVRAFTNNPDFVHTNTLPSNRGTL